MKILYLVARILLGLIFTVFGLNGFLHFLPMQTPPGEAGQFLGVIFQSGFYVLIFATQAIAGILLLVGRFVPFALALLAPVIANILVFHLTMAPAGIAPGLVALVLWVLEVSAARKHFAPLFEQVVRE
jgi:uncharacterized membrane protein YphA (DoxX/SURF4 family)